MLSEPPAEATRGVRTVHAVWDKARAGRQMPLRADIDPAAIGAELLPYVLIGDFQLDPFRVLYRLVGTKLVESAGRDFTGRFLDEMDWPFVPAAIEVYRKVWKTGRPAFGSFGAELTIGGWYSIGFGVLPLRAGNSTISSADKCLVMVDYLDVDMTQLVRPSILSFKPAGR